MNILDVKAYMLMKCSDELPIGVMNGVEPIIYEAMISSGIQMRDGYPDTVEEMLSQGCVNDFLPYCDLEDQSLILEHAEAILRGKR